MNVSFMCDFIAFHLMEKIKIYGQSDNLSLFNMREYHMHEKSLYWNLIFNHNLKTSKTKVYLCFIIEFFLFYFCSSCGS